MAKKAAKKASKKKGGKTTPAARSSATRAGSSGGGDSIDADIVITVGCDGRDCVSDFDGKHTRSAKNIAFCAPADRVTVTFKQGSPPVPAWPFDSGNNPLIVQKGTCVSKRLSASAHGTYSYHCDCLGCGGHSAADPSMIVP